MCFSPEASFTSGFVLLGIGIATLKFTKTKNQIPLALIPVFFGIQQITEGFIWLSLNSSPDGNQIATIIYTFFSHVFWPIYVPFAIYLLEKDKIRKNILMGFQALGLIVGIILIYFLIKYPITSQVINKSINYNSAYPQLIWLPFAYIVATCISCLFSSHKMINFFGVLGMVSAAAVFWVFSRTFVSVWCFVAAILSVVIFLHIFNENRLTKSHKSRQY